MLFLRLNTIMSKYYYVKLLLRLLLTSDLSGTMVGETEGHVILGRVMTSHVTSLGSWLYVHFGIMFGFSKVIMHSCCSCCLH